ncbi:MAG: hypothetical protein LBB74_09490, partial [Chitinispirillales bacterium]|nr:hypothetical protein [Chitinispirillales bacterium]
MKGLFSGRARVFFSLTAVVFSGMILFGCGSNNSGSGFVDNPFVNSNGEAWMFVDEVVGGGVYFGADGRVFMIYHTGTVWAADGEGTYTVTPNNTLNEYTVTVTGNNIMYGTYTVTLSEDGGTATLSGGPNGEYAVLARTQGINFTAPPVNNGTGGNLVLSSGYAWSYNSGSDGAHKEGYQFLSNGTVYDLDYGYIGAGRWQVERQGTYTTSGANIAVIWEGTWTETGTYTVSGSSLTLTLGGDRMHLTATSGVTFDSPSTGGSGGSLVLSSGQGWSRSAGSYYEGYQFLSNGTVYDLDRGYSSSYGDNWRIERTGTY